MGADGLRLVDRLRQDSPVGYSLSFLASGRDVYYAVHARDCILPYWEHLQSLDNAEHFHLLSVGKVNSMAPVLLESAKAEVFDNVIFSSLSFEFCFSPGSLGPYGGSVNCLRFFPPDEFSECETALIQYGSGEGDWEELECFVFAGRLL